MSIIYYKGPRIRNFYLTLITSLVLRQANHIVSGETSPINLLKSQEFKLEARIGIVRDKSEGIDEEVSVTEHYSNNDQRARLNIHPRDELQERLTSFYYDASSSRQMLLEIDSGSNGRVECKLVGPYELVASLFGALITYDSRLSGRDWLEERPEVPEYVIGTARLLLIVHSHKDELEIQTSDPEKEIRNIQTTAYKLQVHLGGQSSEKWSLLTVYYGKSVMHSPEEPDLPMRIVLSLPNGAEILLDYFSIRSTDANQDFTGKRGDQISSFTFPLGFGCSKWHQTSELLNAATLGQLKLVSFRADVLQLRSTSPADASRLRSYFIAYDGFIKALRRDTIRDSSARYSDDDSPDPDYLISVYDLRGNRKWSIRQSSLDAGSVEKPGGQEVTRCVSTKVSSEDRLARTLLEPIFPFDQMLEMGPATVRGTQARAFEFVTRTMPPILFMPVNFVDSSRKSRLLFSPDPKLSQTDDKGAEDLSVVYYFSKLAPNPGQSFLDQLGLLLRIDIMRSGELILRAEVYEFAWQLVAAPNGDPADELFALRDRCGQRNSLGHEAQGSRYAHMTMELQCGTPGRPANDSLEPTIKALSNPVVRNKSLLRAIVSNSDLLATHVYSLESRLISNDDSFRIHMKARLVEPSLGGNFYEVISVGSGHLNGGKLYPLEINFDECVWRALHNRHRARLLFSFCHNFCLIDDNPSSSYHHTTEAPEGDTGDARGPPRALTFSGAVLSNESSECQVFQIDAHQQAANNPEKYWTNLHRSLFKLLLPVQLRAANENKPITELPLEVKHLELADEQGSLVRRNPNSPEPRMTYGSVLRGVGMLPSSAIEAPSNENGRDFSDDWTGQSFSRCRTACLSNLRCHSYSVCMTGRRQIECLVSELHFKNSLSLSQIQAKADEMRRHGKSGNFFVSFTLNAGTSQEGEVSMNNTGVGQVELRLDGRCVIYNKNALESFELSPNTLLMRLKSGDLVEVENEEQCASICLQKNLKFLELATKWRSDMLTAESNSEQESSFFRPSEKLLEPIKFNGSNTSRWCDAFRFLDLASTILHDSIREKIEPDDAEKNGICIVTGPTWTGLAKSNSLQRGKESEAPQGAFNTQPVMVQNYNFIYSTLYEPTSGLRLMPRPSQAFDGYNNEGIARLGNNQIIMSQSSVEICAHACFMQTTGLRPWCKSFDFVEDSTPRPRVGATDESEVQRRTYCVLSSISLSQAILMERPEELVATQVAGEATVVWHYEPNDAANLDSVTLSKLIELGHLERPNNFSSTAGNILVAVIIIILASVGGLVFGLNLGCRIGVRLISGGGRRESVANPSRSFLNSLTGCELDELHSGQNNERELSYTRFEPDLYLPELPVPGVELDESFTPQE